MSKTLLVPEGHMKKFSEYTKIIFDLDTRKQLVEGIGIALSSAVLFGVLLAFAAQSPTILFSPVMIICSITLLILVGIASATRKNINFYKVMIANITYEVEQMQKDFKEQYD